MPGRRNENSGGELGDAMGKKENPVERANVVSQVFLWWILPLFFKGYQRTLTKDDVWSPPPQENSKELVKQLEKNWKNQTEADNQHVDENSVPLIDGAVKIKVVENGNHKNATPGGGKKLLKALVETFKLEYFILWLYYMFTDCVLKVIQPLFLLWLIRSFMTESTVNERWFYAGGVCVVTFLITLTYIPLQFRMGRIAMRVRIALGSIIQRKMMRLSGVDGHKVDSGKTITLTMNDVSAIERNVAQVPYIIISILQLAIFVYYLWYEFGTYATAAGVGFVLSFAFFIDWYGSQSHKLRGIIGEKTDERTQKITEVIAGINAIKTNSWESIFRDLVQRCRKLEVEALHKRSMLHGFFMSIFLTSSRFAPFLTFMVFVLQGGPLTADRVFFSVAVFNTATHYVGFLLPSAVRGMGEILGSLKRIENFLLLPEKNLQNEYKNTITNIKSQEVSIKVTCRRVTWPNGTVALQNLSLNLDKPQLVVVVGEIASGKTALMHLLLGELSIHPGNGQMCHINGRLSYASQEPWLMNGSIKRNILLHGDFNERRYRQAIYFAGLGEDINNFPERDETSVGEGGSALSGGQRARVSLARAFYQDADIYLIDGVLSNLDSRVSRHIFEEGFNKGLDGKLRIIVANQHQFLQQADLILVVKEGEITAQGTYQELLDRDTEFIVGSVESGDCAEDVDSVAQGTSPKAFIQPEEIQLLNNVRTSGQSDEVQITGTTKWSTYKEYFFAANSLFQFFAYLSIFIISQVFATVIEFWLAHWTNYEESIISNALSLSKNSTGIWNNVESNDTLPDSIDDILLTTSSSDFMNFFRTNLGLELDQTKYLVIYAVLTLLVLFSNVAKSLGFFHYCISICRNIHKELINCLLRAKPEFFDKTPTGVITNRSTKDMQELDESIPFAFFDMFTIFLQIGTVMILILYSIQSLVFLLGIVVFFCMLYFIRSFYVSTSRDLKRLEAIARSPIGSELTSCFSGLVTIRAMGAVNKLTRIFDDFQDDYTSTSFAFLACNKCFDMWVEFIATGLLTAVTFGFLIAQHYFDMTFLGGNVGLAICNAMSLTNWLSYGMRTSANVTNCMISAERALEYTKLESEAAEDTPEEHKPSRDWPSSGKINFQNVTLKYDSNGREVLSGINFEIKARERVGIVGHTGAGKSSVLRALLRLTESQGKILIDGVDIRNLGLRQLRQIISIIPQQAVLFSNTLKFNLDPTGMLNDDAMNRVLEKIHLNKHLDDVITNSGRNLCVGERQLVTLARALLQNRKILAMDEATAHLDSQSENIVQIALNNYQNSESGTVITIAHKISTVIDYDRIMVLSEGKVEEFDEPHQLLQIADGKFTAFVNGHGTEIANSLKEKAKLAHEARKRRTK